MTKHYKSAVIRIKLTFFKNILHFAEKHRMLSIFAAVFLLGVAAGALLNISPVANEWTSTLSTFLMSRHYGTFFDIFRASFSPLFLFLIIAFLSGFFVFGPFISPVIPFVRGLGIGICSGQLIAIYSFKGIFVWVFIMLPGIFISSFALIFGCAASFSFSGKLFSQLRPDRYTLDYNTECKKYLAVYSVLLVVTAASSAADALFSCLLVPAIGI